MAEEKTTPHFLGAVVLQQQPTASAEIETRLVIDGQQRMTTLQLLLDAVQEVVEGLGYKKEATRLSRLVINTDGEGDQAFKLWPTIVDRDPFGERRKFADRLDRRLLRRREQEETAKWFASREWDWFLTLTFPLRSPDEHHTLDWCKRQWHRHLIVPFSKRLWGRRWRRNRKGLFGVATWERQRNGAWHAHALVSGTRRLRQWEVVDY